MLTVALVLGILCIVSAPLLVVAALIIRRKLGSEIASVDPTLWEQMKPGLYSDIRVSRQHRLRLKEFILTREYLALNNPAVNRLAVAYRAISWAGLITLVGAAVTVAAVLWG